MKTTLIYRCCEADTKQQFRPNGFSKVKCLNNLFNQFIYYNRLFNDFRIIAVHDGPKGDLYDILSDRQDDGHAKIIKIDYQSNQKSLEHVLDLAQNINTDIIYFVEDDYLHKTGAAAALLEGFLIVQQFMPHKKPIVTLYDHPDRYTRTDDADSFDTKIFLGLKEYWRTAESTTCTWATTAKNYRDGIYKNAKEFLLDDRGFFRRLFLTGHRLIQPMTGYSTHCHLPYLSPYVDWESYF
jgi:hypothetical protein